MFAIVQDGNIMMMVPPNSAFEWGGNFYPANWCNLSSPEEKAAIGMVGVVYGPQLSDQYYWVTEDTPVYNAETNQVYIGFTCVGKDLAQTKSDCVSQINNSAYNILLPTDWMVVKGIETGTPVPTDWNTWRQSIRTTAQDTVTAIDAAVDVAEVEAIMNNVVWPSDPNQGV